jgi:hypothetical protein
MNRFIGLIIMVVAVAALAGAAIGWRFPFLGQNRSLNQIGTAQEGTQGQTTAQRQALSAKQPTQKARNTSATGTRSLQAQNTNVDTSTTVNTQSGQSDSNEPVPALW